MGVIVGRTTTIAVGVAVALGAQDASTIIIRKDKKIILRKLISQQPNGSRYLRWGLAKSALGVEKY